MAQFELVFLNGARAGAVVPVEGEMIAGRSPDCLIEVPDPNASRHHIQITQQGEQLIAKDLGSANGVFLNEQRFSEGELSSGDIVRLGETRMRVQSKRPVGAGGHSDSSLSGTSFRMRENEGQEDVNLSMSMSMIDMPKPASVSVSAAQQRLEAIMSVSEQLANIAKLEDLYGPVIDSLFKVFPQADRGFILLGHEVGKLEPVAIRQRGKKADVSLTVSRSLCAAALEKKSIIVYQDGGDADFDQGMSLISLNIRSAMVVPLMVKDEILGLVLIDTPDRRRSFTNDDMELAATVCVQVAIAIKNALLFEQQESDAITRRNLMRFLPKPVADQCLDGDVDIELGGSSYEGTVFFSDVIGFTRMSEQLSPEDVVATMNDYFNLMVPCIENEGGAIDKFIGDAIMAFWGIPFKDDDSARKGVHAALSMQTALAAFNNYQLKAERPQINMGIGLATGPVVAGNIGSADRVEYTVLGDTVNTASRIEATACTDQVLIAQETWNQLGDKAYGVAMPPLSVKNKQEPLNTYSIRGVKLEDGEILMHVPIKIGAEQACIVRCLMDKSFTILHREECNFDDNEIIMAVIELPEKTLGKCKVLSKLPEQENDSGLRRTLVTLGDDTVGGLLDNKEPAYCDLDWQRMSRSTSVKIKKGER